MQPHEAARLLDIHPNTVRTWTSDKRYKRFFSDTAQGGDGSARDLTDDDIRVLHYIDQMKDRGLRADEVEASLEQAQAQGFDRLPMPVQSDAIARTPVIPVQAAEAAVRGKQDALEIMREEMRERLQEMRELVEYERSRAQEERERYEQSNERIRDLERQVGKLEGKLSILERELGVNGVGDSNVT